MKNDDASWPEKARIVPEGRRRVRLIHQNIAAHYGIELFGSGKIIEVRGLKRDPRGTALFHRALASPLQRGRVAIKTNDAASRTNDVGHKERNIPNSGA